MVTMHLLVGLPASGKTTRAKELAREHRGLRLTPDEWMIPLFGEPEAGGKRDVLEGRLIRLALNVLDLGTNVVLDLGCWGRDERSALRWLAGSVGASFLLVYLPIDRETELQRIADRWAREPQRTYPMTATEVDRWRAQFQAPDPAELSGIAAERPPAPWRSWADWAAERWPSLDQG